MQIIVLVSIAMMGHRTFRVLREPVSYSNIDIAVDWHLLDACFTRNVSSHGSVVIDSTIISTLVLVLIEKLSSN